MKKTSDFFNNLLELIDKHSVSLALDEIALLGFDNS